MKTGSKSSRFLPFGLLIALGLTPAMARAQDDAKLRAAEPQPAPPPATAPAPADAAADNPGAAAPTAAADVAAPEAPTATSDEPRDPKPEKKKKNKKKRGRDHEASRDDAPPLSEAGPEYGGLVFSSVGGTLQLKGRVFALAELRHRTETVVGVGGGLVTRDVSSLDLSLNSARFGIEYHSPLRWLSAELELEIADRPEVKDAYVQAGKRFFAKAGQFKIPTAALELESPWTLPLVRRGLVNELLTDWLDVAGRRPGVALGFRCKCELKPRITMGAFQGTTLEEVVPGDRDVQLIDKASMDAQSFAVRGELKLSKVLVGAWYEHRVASRAIGEFEHLPTFGLDATLDETFENGGLRVWLDGGGGKSLYVNADKPETDKDPLFLVGRGLVGYRFGGVALGDPYVEPFGFFALFDPDTEVVADFATEAALGVNAGYWDRARLTLQAEMTNGERNFPTDFLDNVDPDRLSVLLQAGARF